MNAGILDVLKGMCNVARLLHQDTWGFQFPLFKGCCAFKKMK